MPGGSRDAAKEYDESRLPGSVRFDIDKVCTATPDKLPHMMPSSQQFAEEMKRLNIKETDTVICYAKEGSPSSARVWHTFRAFGHPTVKLLNGSTADWESAGGKLVTSSSSASENDDDDDNDEGNSSSYPATASIRGICDSSRVVAAATSNQNQNKEKKKAAAAAVIIVDARSEDRFKGLVDEPRASCQKGRIPTSVNLPFNRLLVPGSTTKYKSIDEMMKGN
jgi:thiosulfate/3-mercaptopyruvate sulfurtransferase